MPDWILGLRKAAIEPRAGVSADDWMRAMGQANSAPPEELRELYEQFNGATFGSGVTLFPLRGVGAELGVLEHNRSGTAGLPTTDIWRFGEKADLQLAAVRKSALQHLEGAKRSATPRWLENLRDDDWVFIARGSSNATLWIYRSLEELLTSLVPPADSEDFGDRTFARALTLVEDALAGITSVARNVTRSLTGGRKKQKPTKKKAAPPRRAAKVVSKPKKVAKKAGKTAAKKAATKVKKVKARAKKVSSKVKPKKSQPTRGRAGDGRARQPKRR